MSEQVQASVQARRKLSNEEGYVLLAKDVRNGQESWVWKTLSGDYHPFPRRLFNTITDFHDYISYKLQEQFQ